MADDPEDELTDGTPQAVDPNDLKSSKGWLALIKQAEVYFEDWQSVADSVDKLYANLGALASVARDREYQLFWANVQVLGPSIYSRPPVPVITPRFKDQKPLPRTASELLERSTIVTFDTQDLDSVMLLLRDDLNIVARGAAWVRYEAAKKGEGLGQRVCVEHKDRHDFLHDPARIWAEVDWVAGASYLTRSEMRKRFQSTSGDAYKNATYAVRKDPLTGKYDKKLKAKVWEIWCKSKNACYWVAEGALVFLDEGKPHLDLEGFFPCPRPAYGTVQRRSLVPVPDALFYKDQLEEINEYTARISALSESLRLKGFYPGGAGELSDAIEAAMKRQDDNQLLIPVSNWALIGNGQPKDMIVWIPIDMVATTITELVALRKEVIEDVYQIMGLSDIMRGSTQASETLGAQQLKSEYGSVRLKDKQSELVRIARDITCIAAEIMAENFTGQSLLDMSQLDIPTNAEIQKQVDPLAATLKKIVMTVQQASKDPRAIAIAKQQPDQAKQMIDQAQQQAQQIQGQIQKLQETVTIEEVMTFLRDNRTRVFDLDIETDSTITPDENAAKQRMTEYATAMGGLLKETLPTIQAVPQAAPLLAAIIRKVNSTFRVGRDFEQVVDDFTDQMKQLAAQPKPQGPTPEQITAQSDAQKAQLAAQQQQIDAQAAEGKAQLEQGKLALQKEQQDAANTLAAQKQADDVRMREAEIAAENERAQLAGLVAILVKKIGIEADTSSMSVEAMLEQATAQMDHQQTMQQAEQEHQHELELQANDITASSDAQAADQEHEAGMLEAQPADGEETGEAPPASPVLEKLDQLQKSFDGLAAAYLAPVKIDRGMDGKVAGFHKEAN